ncbi:hypothetical protein CMT41_07430 [Colwellia sp. MT41]|uniref:hypothetical protein n=1 Tax=Colwellia sp. MT41 TaxID=58049 RepID=UPI000717815F|nr:hypothetical protein [Colwellia sp. MT41]ALO34566.1 hypothetical protein CMT41_07430 [Colwellia sp. MT41]
MLPESWGGIGNNMSFHCIKNTHSSYEYLDTYMGIPAFLRRSVDEPKLFDNAPITYRINQPEYL